MTRRPLQVNDLRVRSALVFLRVIHADDATVLDGEIGGFGIFRVERGDPTVVKNEIGKLICHVASVIRFIWNRIDSIVPATELSILGCNQP